MLQRNGGREAVDGVHGWDGELVEKSTCVGRDGFEVAALRFRVKCSERKRGLAGAGNAGEDDERVAGNIDVDIAKIMLASATNTDDAITLGFGFQGILLQTLGCERTDSWSLLCTQLVTEERRLIEKCLSVAERQVQTFLS